MLVKDSRSGIECRRMSFPARATRTVLNRGVQSVHLVTNSAAKATPFHFSFSDDPTQITVHDNRRRRTARTPPQFGFAFQFSTDVFSVRLISLLCACSYWFAIFSRVSFPVPNLQIASQFSFRTENLI